MANNAELSICGQGDSEVYIQVAHQHPVIIPKIKYPQERMLFAKKLLIGWLGGSCCYCYGRRMNQQEINFTTQLKKETF